MMHTNLLLSANNTRSICKRITMVLKSVVHRLCLTSLIVALASGQTIRNDALHNHLGAFDTESGRAQLRPLFSILMVCVC